jgi:hypothetical protein
MGVVNTGAGDRVMEGPPEIRATQESEQTTYSTRAFGPSNKWNSSPAKKMAVLSNLDKSTSSKNNYQISHDFVIRLYQNEDEENPFYHGFCKETSHALASFWQTKSFGSTKAGGGNKIWRDFDVDSNQFPAPMREYLPNLTDGHYEKLLGTTDNVVKRDAYPPEADGLLPPSRPWDSSAGAYGSQWKINPIKSRISTGQALAMIGQARYLETNKVPSGVNVLRFKRDQMEHSLLVPQEIEGGQTVLEAIKQVKAKNSRLFRRESSTSVLILHVVLEDGDKIIMTKEEYKIWTICNVFSIPDTPSNVTLEISYVDQGSDDMSDGLEDDDLEDYS